VSKGDGFGWSDLDQNTQKSGGTLSLIYHSSLATCVCQSAPKAGGASLDCARVTGKPEGVPIVFGDLRRLIFDDPIFTFAETTITVSIGTISCCESFSVENVCSWKLASRRLNCFTDAYTISADVRCLISLLCRFVNPQKSALFFINASLHCFFWQGLQIFHHIVLLLSRES
jgi:hypothetical protein